MNTLFDKIWDAHVVQIVDAQTQLYIDRLYCHEVTSPQAFSGLRARVAVLSPRANYLHARSQHTHRESRQANCRPGVTHSGRDLGSKRTGVWIDSLRNDAPQQWNHPCCRSRAGIHTSGNDYRVWRLSHLYSRCSRSYCLWSWYERGRDGNVEPVHLAGETKEHAHQRGGEHSAKV